MPSVKHSLLKTLFIVALLAVALVACNTVQATPQAEAQPESQAVAVPAAPQASRYITVVGVGRVNLTPDIARIDVGAEVRADTVSAAKAEVDRQMAAISAALQEMGITEKDIQTSHYSIYYEREPYGPVVREEASQESQGWYRVSSMLNVTVRDIDRAGDVLDAVVEAGANQVYGVTFTVSDDQKWESEARQKAMADARARAEELASLANVELGEVLSVSEVVGGMPVSMAFAERAMGGGGIAPGELELSTQIQVSFAIQ
jgi:uncharacterized protein YggE